MRRGKRRVENQSAHEIPETLNTERYLKNEDGASNRDEKNFKHLGSLELGRRRRQSHSRRYPMRRQVANTAGREVCEGPSNEPSSLYDSDQENGRLSSKSSKDTDTDSKKLKNVAQTKKQGLQKNLTKDSSPFNAPKAFLKKSSRFFSASFFSSEGTEFIPASLFHGLIEYVRKQLPKLIVGSLFIGARIAVYVPRAERISHIFLQPDIITTSIDEVSSNAKPLVHQMQEFPNRVKKLVEMFPHQEVNEEETSLFDMLWLLLASVEFVPIFKRTPLETVPF
ncbi:hypothetical protein U1Q18_038580 [Sarracenia purpurea var. burkii]